MPLICGSRVVEGRVFHSHGQWHELRAARVVGRRLRVVLPGEADAPVDAAVFDRQIRVFGAAGQRVLGQLHVGVVGAGGTGSAVIEQLTRLGVGRLTIVDPKALTAGNVTRVYGSTMKDVKKNKAATAADRAIGVGLGTAVTWRDRNVTEMEAAWALRHCDTVFGCTDDNAGRSVISRLGYWYLYPVIDTAVIIDPDPASGEIRGIVGRVTVAGPGAACLVCRGRVDQARAAGETMDPQERVRLAEEGYVPGLDDPDPSVVAFTTNVAATAVAVLLDRVFGYGDDPLPTELLLMLHRYEIRRTARTPRPGCYCTEPAALGAADTAPFLDRTWT